MARYWFTQGASALPIFVVLWTLATFCISYITAVLLKDVTPILPYISDTAGRPPESCVFGMMLSASALAAAATMFVRYRQVESAPQLGGGVCLNRAGFLVGLASCFGLLVVANFQNTTERLVHTLGAGLAFACGSLYALLQALASRGAASRALLCTRVLSSAWSLASGLVMLVAVSLASWDVVYKDQATTLTKVSAAAEWSLGVSFLAFFLTFIRDFQAMSFRVVAELSVEPLAFPNERSRLLPS